MVATGIASLLSPEPKELNMTDADSVLASPYLAYMGTPGCRKPSRQVTSPAWTLMQGVLEGRGFRRRLCQGRRDPRSGRKASGEVSHLQCPIDLCARANGDLARFQALLDAWFGTFEDQLTAWVQAEDPVCARGPVDSRRRRDERRYRGYRAANCRPIRTKVRKAVVLEAMAAANRESIEAHVDFNPRDKARDAFEEAASALKRASEALAACARVDGGNAKEQPCSGLQSR